MSEDAGKLLELMLVPNVSRRYTAIRKMQPGSLVKRLEHQGASISGDMSELQGRLLRLEARRVYPRIAIPWYLEDEVLKKAEVNGRKCCDDFLRQPTTTEKQTPPDDLPKMTTIEEKQTPTKDHAQDAVIVKAVSEPTEKATNAGIIYPLILCISICLRWLRNRRRFSFPWPARTWLVFAFDALTLALYTWLLDSYVLYNKGLHIYATVYWTVTSLCTREQRIYAYARDYPFEHRTKLLMHSLMRVALVTFAFVCVNSFVWYDNAMLVGLLVLNFLAELCVLVREINEYEREKRVPNYFLYTVRE